MYPNTKLLISGIIGKSEREQTDMPHAILRVTNMTGIIVREFYLSFPEDLQRRFFSMFSGIGLKPLMNAGGEVEFEGEFESVPAAGGRLWCLCRNGNYPIVRCCFVVLAPDPINVLIRRLQTDFQLAPRPLLLRFANLFTYFPLLRSS